MSDQADGLRQLVRARRGSAAASVEPAADTPRRATRCLRILGAKGGVGASNVAINLAVGLAARGRRVDVIDADPERAHLGLLLGHRREFGGVRLLENGPIPDVGHEADDRIVDLGSGIGAAASLVVDAEPIVLVTSPEPTSMNDARALLRRLAAAGLVGVELIVNQAQSASEAVDCLGQLDAWCRHGLGLPAQIVGHVRRDARVPRAVRAGQPFVNAYPYGPAARDVSRLARRLSREPRSSSSRWTAVADRSDRVSAGPPPK